MPANICVLTPSYSNKVSTHYLASLIGYTNVPGLNFRFETLPNDSLVNRARNRLFTKYHFDFDTVGYSHLFWQDDDIYVDGEGLLRIAELNLDVVGIAVPLKQENVSRGISCAVVGVYEEVAPMLYKTEFIGTGALLLSNKAVTALADYCWDNNDYYYEIDDPNEIYDVFKTGVVDGFYMSEDWYLCDLLKRLGFDIYVDSSTETIHAGEHRLWKRPPMPIDKRALTQPYRDPLPPELQLHRWTPNDFRNPLPRTIK